jgi:hypothetical protein
MPKLDKKKKKPTHREELSKETLFADIEDMYHRLSGVDGRNILMLILKSVVAANPHAKFGKQETRLRKIESLLFGNLARQNDDIIDEDVMLYMYRTLLEKRIALAKDSTRSKTVSGGVEEIAKAAVDYFQPTLIPAENQPHREQAKRETLLRRYKENFSSQRTEIRYRFYELYYEGEETKIVANALTRILIAVGLTADVKEFELRGLNVTDQELEEYEREFEVLT